MRSFIPLMSLLLLVSTDVREVRAESGPPLTTPDLPRPDALSRQELLRRTRATIATENPVVAARQRLLDGRAALAKGSLRDGCALFEEATRILPTWWIPRLEFVQCARLIGVAPEVLLSHLLVALEVDPGKPTLRHLLGVVYEDHGDLQQARAAYAQAIALAPWMPEPRVRLAAMDLHSNRLAEARGHLEALLKGHAHHLVGRNLMAEVLLRMGREREALVHLEVVAARSGYREHALARLALLYQRLGMDAEQTRALSEIKGQ
jgi:tetratricopeptide (TPR) repeat protein